MMFLDYEELKGLRILACFNRDTMETNNFADRLTHDLLKHDFDKEPIVQVSIPKRTLIKFANYSLGWEKDDSLGIKLREELSKRMRATVKK